MTRKNALLWLAFGVFVTIALVLRWHDGMLSPQGRFGAGKVVIWVAFAGFAAYTWAVSLRADLLAGVRQLAAMPWGRQVSLDLYVGLLLTMCLIAVHEGSGLVALLWLLPTLAFGNLATLLYVAIHYDSLIGRFLG